MWKHATLILLGAVMATMFGLSFRRSCPEPEPAAIESVSKAAVSVVKPQRQEIVELMQPEDHQEVVAPVIPRRNLFAFAADETIRPRPTTRVPPSKPETRIALPEARPETVDPTPRFDYKYVGRFGTELDPIAVFTSNGAVIDARAGERIAGQFTLRGIGLESVEVMYSNAAGAGVLRVPIAQSSQDDSRRVPSSGYQR